MKSLYNIECENLGETSIFESRWACKELHTEGSSLEELLNNATYFFTDQDGGELGSDRADDYDAVDFITSWYEEHKTPDLEAEPQPSRQKDPMTLAKNFAEDRD